MFWLHFDLVWAALGIHPVHSPLSTPPHPTLPLPNCQPLAHFITLAECLATVGPHGQKGNDQSLNSFVIRSFICPFTSSLPSRCRRRIYLSSGNSPWLLGFLTTSPTFGSFHLILVRMNRSRTIMPLYREVTWPVKIKCKKVVEEGLESRSSASKTSPAWDCPIVALCRASWQESMSGYPNLKPAWSAVGSALTSWPKPHPLYSHFSDIFCNVILIFTALSQTSKPWFPF